MTQTVPSIGQLFRYPLATALSADGKQMPNAYRVFYYTNSTTPAPVYQDPALQTPYTQFIFANSQGQFAPLYLNPAIEYRSQLFDQQGRLQEDVDPVNNNTGGAAPTMTAGVPVGYGRSAFKATGTSRTTFPQSADPDLSIQLPCAGTYKIDLDIVYTANPASASAVTAQIAFIGKLGPGAASNTSNGVYQFVAAGAANGAAISAAFGTPVINTNFTLPGGVSPSLNVIRFTGTFQTLTGGTLSFNWGAYNGTGTVTLLAGCSLSALQVA